MADKETLQLVLPPGRMISGSVQEMKKVDHKGNALTEDKWHWYIGLAVEKARVGNVLNDIFGLACRGYQSNPFVMSLINLGLTPPLGQQGFHWKIKDGDATDPATGQPMYEHGRGCWIFHLSNRFPIKTCDAQNRDIDPKLIERGYYVDAGISVSINGSTDATAGVYLNLQAVRLLGRGEIIQGGASADQIFGGAFSGALPAGASMAPVTPAGAGMPPMPGQPAPGMPAPGGMPQPQYQQQPAPAPQYQPAPQPQMMPASGNAVPAMPQPVVGHAVPQANAPLPTGYPTNVQPHTGFVTGGMPGMPQPAAPVPAGMPGMPGA
ncbi:hypothetical protein HMSP1_59 [Sinorhizobium phage HMSP1-Susan]|nr:hypothetical protein HMSP1_59 [Sinorhizobium phage HMSP1-Susan]